VVEICAGAGGQALGLEKAGFSCEAAIEIDSHACATLNANRPKWDILETDVKEVDGTQFKGVDLLAGGVPCPPFSVAGKQLGANDERDLFPEALRLAEEINPRAILLENVQGFAGAKFAEYRRDLFRKLDRLGYRGDFRVIHASDHGVPQLRPRFVLVALRPDEFERFSFLYKAKQPNTVGTTLVDLMEANGWKGAGNWSLRANKIAPTLVGGSKKHGGPDLGPTRAKRQWLELGVDGMGVANEAPFEDFPLNGNPKLTVRMTARIQGFPDQWKFVGKKTNAYRQVGNAFPPPVAEFVGSQIAKALNGRSSQRYSQPSERQLSLLEKPVRKSLRKIAKKK
jgi:DNA (cytosine-5)-methyltransferase 1